MRSTNWRAIAELIGIVAIVASLIFVGRQIQQEQEIAIADTNTSVTSNVGDLASLVAAAPDVWRRGLDGEELSTEEEIQFLAIAKVVEMHMLNMHLRFLRLGIGDPDIFPRNYAYALYVHPGLRRAFLGVKAYREFRAAAFNQESYWNPFDDFVTSHLQQLDDTVPAIPSEKRYVFW